MANKFTAGMTNVVQALNEMWNAFAAGPYNALPLTGGALTGPLTAPAVTAVRQPTNSEVLGEFGGWFKIAKLKMTNAVFGPDAVIRVSGTTTYAAAAGRSNGAVTTIIARVTNNLQISGSFHTECASATGTPTDVRFGADGSIYLLAEQYQRLSVHIDAHPMVWEAQAIEYIPFEPTGTPAVRAWGLHIGNPVDGVNLLVDDTNITSICNIRAKSIAPIADNAFDVGEAALAYRTIYARTGTINTSDARLKTDFRDLTTAEIAAALDIARAIGIYRWRDAVDCKGDGAREHLGPTVQRAIEIMQNHGLNPFGYGFICHDVWERQIVEHAAVEARAAVPATAEVPALLDNDGSVLVPAVPAQPGYPAIEARAAYTEVVLEAGDRYAFRYDELAMFIAAGQEARLAAQEVRLAALGAQLVALEAIQ